MLSLLQFPPPPRIGAETVLERDGCLTEVDAIESGNSKFAVIGDLPDVLLQSGDAGTNATKMDSAHLAFLPHDQSLWKRTLHSWYRAGILGVLEELLESGEDVPSWLLGTSSIMLNGLHRLAALKGAIFPQIGLTNDDILEKYTSISSWLKSPVRGLAWHPHVSKLAVALKDDSVLVYGSVTNVNPCLKHKLQKNVADLSWQPLSSSVLAVACCQCILIWHVEPMSLAVRPSSSTVQILQYPGHSPITSLAWSPESSHLVSSSPRDSSILVWDVPREVCTPLKCGRGGGVAMLQYSPDGSKLFTGMTSSVFRVFETKTWHAEVWSQLSGHCSACCWNPDGTVMIFAMSGENALYAVRYSERVDQRGGMSVIGTSMLLADVSAVTLSSSDGEKMRIGGEVKSIVWDKTGERLAVLFDADRSEDNSVIAVFKSTIRPVLELLPGGFIRGRPGENAHHIAFQPNFQRGAVLSVVWSSGRLGYVPMQFVPAQEIRQTIVHHDPMVHLSSRNIMQDQI